MSRHFCVDPVVLCSQRANETESTYDPIVFSELKGTEEEALAPKGFWHANIFKKFPSC